MKTDKQTRHGEPAFLFSLDILMQGETNGHALERLMALLNSSDDIADYRVTKGVRLGQVIDEAIRLAESGNNGAATGTGTSDADRKAGAVRRTDATVAATATGTGKDTRQPDTNRPPESLIRQIAGYITGRTLVRLTVVKGRGIKLSIPCRILNYDASTDNMTVYHVDEKAVYTFKLAEIDDLTAS